MAWALAPIFGMANIMMMLATVMGRDRINQGRSLPWRHLVLSRIFAMITLVMASSSLDSTGNTTMKLAIHMPRVTVKPRVSVRYLLK